MAGENRTEQATPRRRQKAREKGQIARSRELPSALALLTVVFFLAWQAPQWPAQWQSLLRDALSAASGERIAAAGIFQSAGWVTLVWAAPMLLLAWFMALGSLLAQGGFVFAPAALAFNPERLNPAANFKQLFSFAGMARLLKSLIPVGVLLYLAAAAMMREWDQLALAATRGARAGLPQLLALIFEIGWKSGLVLLAWAGFDYIAQRFTHEQQLRMSREEVREEAKETEGHPLIRLRIRRLQRQLRRRSMMREVAKATVVVTNPSEFAVALRYEPATMDAPVLLAKGRGLLAQQIRTLAIWNSVPVVENPPLARALYRGVEVGQAIPAKLYAAVAEILAFIYRAQAQVRNAAAQAAGAGRGPEWRPKLR